MTTRRDLLRQGAEAPLGGGSGHGFKMGSDIGEMVAVLCQVKDQSYRCLRTRVGGQ